MPPRGRRREIPLGSLPEVLQCLDLFKKGILAVTVEYVEKLYNRYSPVYDLIFGRLFHGGREAALELLDLFAGARLLEVGVGTGLSIPMLPRHITISAIDLSQKMLERAEKRIRELELKNICLVKMDAAKLQFPDNGFDRVLAAYFISAVPDPVRVILEMKRVCKPGGYLVFLNHFQYEYPVLGWIERLLSPLFYRIGFRTDLRLRNMMQECGLRIETMEKIDVLGHWKVVRCINPG